MKKFFTTIIILFFTQLLCIAKEPDENINIVFAIDKNYPVYTMISMYSIVSNTDADNIVFYVLENNMTTIQKKFMKYYVNKKLNAKLNIVNVDTTSFDKGKDFFNADLPYITQIGMARILIPELLPSSEKKALYLDSDILVKNDIKKLFNTDLENNYAGMCLDWLQMKGYPEFPFVKYYNSGVILIDLNLWRKNHVSKQLTDFIDEHYEYFGHDKNSNKIRFGYPDQDLLNIVLSNNIKTLAKNWNTTYLDKNWTGEQYIIHYITRYKPWKFILNYYNVNSPFIDITNVRESKTLIKYNNIYNEYWEESGLGYLKGYVKYFNFIESRKTFYKNTITNIFSS